MNDAKKTLVRILGLTLFAAACSHQENIEHTANFAQSDKPNILLVLVDDMGFSDIGAYRPTRARPAHCTCGGRAW